MLVLIHTHALLLLLLCASLLLVVPAAAAVPLVVVPALPALLSLSLAVFLLMPSLLPLLLLLLPTISRLSVSWCRALRNGGAAVAPSNSEAAAAGPLSASTTLPSATAC
jgi:hypothetical protein